MKHRKRIILLSIIGSLFILSQSSGQVITGRIIAEETGQPVAGASVRVIGQNALSGVTDQAGCFEIRVTPGEYKGVTVTGVTIKRTIRREIISLETGDRYDIGRITVPLEFEIIEKSPVLEITTQPPEASVVIDDELVGETGSDGKLLIEIEPGQYKITIQKENYSPQTRYIALTMGEERRLEMSLHPAKKKEKRMKEASLLKTEIPMQPSPARQKEKIPIPGQGRDAFLPTQLKMAIGLGNPYLSLRVGQQWNLEARAAFGSGIKVFSARVLRDFKWSQGYLPQAINLFVGIEAGSISFDKTVSGKGLLGYIFVGGEYFITNRLALNIDVGPAYISLKEKITDIDLAGIEYVANLGINLYIR